MSGLIRIGAFARKEIMEILRQPRLLLTLILGPFLILLLFGIGYRNEGRHLRAIVVVSRDSAVHKTVTEYARNLGSQLRVMSISSSPAEARAKLRNGEVDIVVIVPDQASQVMQSNRQAEITILHNEVDPYQADYVEFTGQLYIDKLNRWLLGKGLEQKKSELGEVQKELATSIQVVQGMRSALENKDIAKAQENQKKLVENFNRLETKLESEISKNTTLEPSQAEDLKKRKSAVRTNIESMTTLEPDKPDYENETKTTMEMEKDLVYLQSKLTDFRKIDTKVLVSPFISKSESIAKAKPKLPQFFIPSVIVLLLQHLAVTFAGLSIVREFRSGAAELFRVSPLRPLEMILGKYLGYLMVGIMVAAALTAALLYGLKMPPLGDMRYLAGVLSVLLFASLSVGFTLSLLAKTETQAIQYTMIFLLVSIFFSGFLLNLELLWQPIRVISWILPATYGIRLVQDNILRGETPDILLLALLATIGVYFFVVSYRILRTRLAHS